ncbi:hypothetical protein Cgig2_010611 [Carnegiea gigantea]|uniref:Uncharacterized protein n=1 Tax=Carnegiea gigantea TaxID=171969 RepID=A0A9Q1QNV4_9CARY|nr:hypothetical protein Cgig2_010611 [Carnegiea gigantea]
MDTPEDSIEDPKTSKNLEKLHAQNPSLLDALQSQGQSNQSLESKHKEAEGNLVTCQQKLDDAHKREIEFSMAIEELSIERDYLKSEFLGFKGRLREREEETLGVIDGEGSEKGYLEEEIYEGIREREDLVSKIDVGIGENERLLKDIEGLKQRNEELEENLRRGLGVLGSIKEALMRVSKGLFEELGNGSDHGCEYLEQGLNLEGKSDEFVEGLNFVWKIVKRVEEELGDNESYKRKDEQLKESLSRDLGVLGSIKVHLIRVSEALDEKKREIGINDEHEKMEEEVLNFEEISEQLKEMKSLSVGLDFVLKIVKSVEEKLNDFQNKVMKEKRELESSIVSLTEENRDVNTLLRIALVEKEAVEKSLNKLKGNNEQKRVALLQYAERGLQRVGFGFIMGGGGGAATEQSQQQKKDNEQVSENTASSASNASDAGSECEEEVSLASTVEKMMKNLRLEITQLRKALEESRSDAERLQCLAEKQAQQITEQVLYIKELEYQESLLSQNVEELLINIKTTEDNVERWKEACELEVQAAKHAIEERDKLVEILKRELEKTRAALEVSNSKLKLKEELADAAMAAQSAAERSLRLADSRTAVLHRRIEELTRQLEEAESRETNTRRKFRRICWPWEALKMANPTRRVLPEMQALVYHKE